MSTEFVLKGVSNRVGRREFLKTTLGLGVAAATGTLLASGASATSGSQYLRTTTNLNLRETASTNGKIILVIPSNSVVTNHGTSSNGYTKVTYNYKTGWAYNLYLDDVNGGSNDPDVNWVGFGEASTAVNLRSGPSTNDTVLKVLSKGTDVEYSDWVIGGFIYVDVDGTTGWMSHQYLQPRTSTGGTAFVTTTAVNLRADASTSAKVIKVVPKGATVIDYDLVMSNGFRGVDYNGTVGWIYDTYLQKK